MIQRLKDTLKTWTIVYVIITLLLYGLGTWLNQFPLFARTLILSGIMVFLMQYLVIPALKSITKQAK